MGASLRKAKKDNKGVGGKGEGKLTDKMINKLSLYYGLAIRRHPDSVNDMKDAFWATYYHNSSSDEDPQHMYDRIAHLVQTVGVSGNNLHLKIQ